MTLDPMFTSWKCNLRSICRSSSLLPAMMRFFFFPACFHSANRGKVSFYGKLRLSPATLHVNRLSVPSNSSKGGGHLLRTSSRRGLRLSWDSSPSFSSTSLEIALCEMSTGNSMGGDDAYGTSALLNHTSCCGWRMGGRYRLTPAASGRTETHPLTHCPQTHWHESQVKPTNWHIAINQ